MLNKTTLKIASLIAVVAISAGMGLGAYADNNAAARAATMFEADAASIVTETAANEIVSAPSEESERIDAPTEEPNASEAPAEPTECEQPDQMLEHEPVYATSPVNVRSGPGMEYKVLGWLNERETVQRLEILDNGWSKVIYQGEEAFVSTEYLAKIESDGSSEDGAPDSDGSSSSTPAATAPNAPYAGRFTIPDTGVKVNCYRSSSQETVDASNSAAIFYCSGHTTIADHVNQGFSGIKSCNVGTKAYFDDGSGKKEYTCVGVIQGHNTGHGLTDKNHNSIASLHPGTLVCYTCNGNSVNVTIVFFKRVVKNTDEIPEELSGDGNKYYPNYDSGNLPCDAGTHKWELADTFVYWEHTASGRQRYLRECFVCSVCNSDWLKTKPVDDDFELEESEPEETQVTEPTATEAPTEPAEDFGPTEETEATEPSVPEEPTTEATEPETEPVATEPEESTEPEPTASEPPPEPDEKTEPMEVPAEAPESAPTKPPAEVTEPEPTASDPPAEPPVTEPLC